MEQDNGYDELLFYIECTVYILVITLKIKQPTEKKRYRSPQNSKTEY